MRHVHQINEYYCGPAVIQMVLSAFGITTTQKEAARRAKTNEKVGTSTAGLVRAIESYGLRVEAAEPLTLAHLNRALAQGKIVIVSFTELHLNWGHYAIVERITEKDIALIDPAERLGTTLELKRSDFLKRWKDPLFAKTHRWAAFVSAKNGLKEDPNMSKLVARYGEPRWREKKRVFPALLRSIIYQQLSGKAASAIHGRVSALFPKENPLPETLLKIDVHTLRTAGLSIQKIRYARDLAEKCLDGTIDERNFPTMSSQEIIDHLTQVKGIGRWTAHMYLLFTLRRPDILPVGDLGIRKGFQLVYKLKKLPDEKQMEKIAKPWRREASLGAWYLWQAADEAKKSEFTGDW